MTTREVLRKVIDESAAWSQNRLAVEVGLTPQAMSNRMKPGRDMKAGFVARVLGVLGYQLVAVPKGVRLPAGSIVVDGEE